MRWWPHWKKITQKIYPERWNLKRALNTFFFFFWLYNGLNITKTSRNVLFTTINSCLLWKGEKDHFTFAFYTVVYIFLCLSLFPISSYCVVVKVLVKTSWWNHTVFWTIFMETIMPQQWSPGSNHFNVIMTLLLDMIC